MSLTQVTTGGVDENINIDSNTLKVDGTNNRVGINTASPDYALHAVGTIAARDSGTNTDIRLIPGSQQGSYSINANTAQHIFVSGANERMRIDSSGRVGIATAAPQGKLHVKTSSSNGYPTAWGDGQLVVSTGETSTSLGIALSVNNSDNSGSLTCLSPNTSWRELNYRASIHKFFRTDTDESARIDSSGRLLIGTSAAIASGTEKVQIKGDSLSLYNATSSVAGAGQSINFRTDGGATGAMKASISGENDGSYSYSGRLVFKTSTTSNDTQVERMRIDSSGHVDIDSGIIGVATTDNFTLNGKTQPHYGFNLIGSSSSPTGMSGYYGIAFATNGTEQVRITNIGRLLIGSSSGDGKLTVRQSQNTTTTGTFTNPHVKLLCGGTTNDNGFTGIAYPVSTVANYGWTVGAQRISSSGTDGSFVFRHHNNSATGSERFRILAHGSLRASTARTDSDYAENTSDYWHVFHHHVNGQVAAIIEHSGNTTPGGLVIDFSDAAPDNNSAYFLKCLDSSANRMFIYSDGDIDNHDNSYGAISDQKLKQDIVDAGPQWDDIKNLRVRNFKFKSDVAAYGDEAKTLIGVVAQETELVSPGLVKESPDLDDDGNDLGTTTKSVRYSVLYMKAIKALQEAMDRIETLETKVAALEAAG